MIDFSEFPYRSDALRKWDELKQREGEDIQSYLFRATELLTRMYNTGDLSQMPLDRHVTLVTGLKHVHMKRAVAKRNVENAKNMQEVIKIIRDVTESDSVATQYGGSKRPEAYDTDDDAAESVEEVRLGRTTNYNNLNRGYSKYSGRGGSSNARSNNYRNKVICHFCDKAGHKFQDCKSMKAFKTLNGLSKEQIRDKVKNWPERQRYDKEQHNKREPINEVAEDDEESYHTAAYSEVEEDSSDQELHLDKILYNSQ